MLDTLEVARSLTAAQFTPAQADAITNAVRRAAEHGDHVTHDQFKAGLAELRAEIAGVRSELRAEIAGVRGDLGAGLAGVETRLIRWVVGAALAAVGLGVGALVAVMRLWPPGS